MRRMVEIVDASAEKVETLAASVLPAPSGPTRLEVPTLNADGWTPAVLYVVRSEREKATPLAGIASMLGWMFNVAVSPPVLLAAILHFDLDRRDEAPPPAELRAKRPSEPGEFVTGREPATVLEPDADEKLARAKALHEAREAERDTSPVVAHEAAPADDKPAEQGAATSPAWPNPDDPCVSEPWAQKALALHAEGETPFAIARALKMYGATDFKVRCLVVPGFRGRIRQTNNTAREQRQRGTAPSLATSGSTLSVANEQEREDARLRELRGANHEFSEIAAIMKREGFSPRSVNAWIGRAKRLGITPPKYRPQPSLPPVSVPKPQPREPETKPQRKPERRAVAKASPAVLPWSIPPKEATLPTDIPADGAGVTLLALTVDSCRWPMGKGADGHETYCGCQKSAHGSSYCDFHAKGAFNQWPPSAPIKRPTRMARSMSALPAAQNQTAQRRA
jgi:hypothetical protein